MTDLNSGAMAGTISAEQTKYGVVFTPHLTGLPTGLHGFHVHVNPSCGTTEKMGKAVLGSAAGVTMILCRLTNTVMHGRMITI